MSNLPEPELLTCERCGRDRSEHYAANLSDGAFVGRYLLICPSVVFKAEGCDELQYAFERKDKQHG